MFDNIQAYAGNVASETPGEYADNENSQVQSEPQTPDEIIEYARREAEDILDAARQEAISERDAILRNAAEQSEQRIAKDVVNAAKVLRLDLLSSKVAMGKILSDALDTIVGEIGHDRLIVNAIEKASSEYSKDQRILIFANKKTLERLRLVMIGYQRKMGLMPFSFALDAGLTDGRCILSREGSRVEIGLDAQIDALKKVFDADSAKAIKSSQADLGITGKLM